MPVQRVPGAPSHRRADEAQAKPKRERVVLGGGGPAEPLPSRVELTEHTGWGQVLIKDLIGVQLRVGLLVALGCALFLAALPAVLWLLPGAATWSAGGVGLVWIVVGILPFPLLAAVGVAYHRAAERQERAFVDMIE